MLHQLQADLLSYIDGFSLSAFLLLCPNQIHADFEIFYWCIGKSRPRMPFLCQSAESAD